MECTHLINVLICIHYKYHRILNQLEDQFFIAVQVYSQLISIPTKVTTIEEYLLCECSNLTSIEIHNNVDTIKTQAFAYCTSLISMTIISTVLQYNEPSQTITIPTKVTAIESSLFVGCINITSIVVEGNLTLIEESAFKQCTNLNYFYYKGTTNPSIKSTSFSNTQIDEVYVTNNYGFEKFGDFNVSLHP